MTTSTAPMLPTPTSRPYARPWRGLVVAGLLVALAGCGGGGGSDAGATTSAPEQPAGCDAAPFRVGLGVGAGTEAAPFEVADAGAQRVSILPGRMAFSASEMDGLSSQAGVTPLGQYTVYVTDGELDASQLGGTDAGDLVDGSATVAAVQIAPASDGGFVEGETVAPSVELGYETRSGVVPVRAAIVPEGSEADLALTDEVTGTVTVLAVGDEDLCLDVDLTIAGEQGGRIEGTVLAPVTRAGDAYFVT